MKTYELTYIISSGLSSEEVESAVKDVDAFIQSKGGVIVSSEKSQAKPFAYRIKKQGSGYFVTSALQLEESAIKELKAKLELEKSILRHLIMVKKPVKIVKPRRTRKPLATSEKPATTETEPKKAQEKMNPEDLDKKLDEILS